MSRLLPGKPLSGAACAVAMCCAVFSACSQESADRAAKAVEKAPAQIERQTERAAVVADDVTITTKIKSALLTDPAVKGRSIDVETRHNVVTLSGTVETREESMAAERIARQVEGVTEVTNNLVIKR